MPSALKRSSAVTALTASNGGSSLQPVDYRPRGARSIRPGVYDRALRLPEREHRAAARPHDVRHAQPGGQLVVANFMPGIRDVGYMEAFMDWRLIYRTRHDMTDLTMEIEEPEIRDLSLFTEESRNIIFLRLTKN